MTGLTWVASPLVLLGSYAAGWLSSRVGVAIANRNLRGVDEGASWVERARRSYPARVVAGKNLAFAPYAVGAMVGAWVAPELGLPVVPLTILAGLSALIAVMGVTTRLERKVCGPGAVPVSFVLILPGLVTFGLMLAAMPSRWGWPAALVVLAGLASVLFQICGLWLIPLRWFGLVRPASERLATLVDRAAGRMGIRHRGVFELDSPHVNAIAWPVPRVLVFTDRMIELLKDDEISSIAAHELAHLDESWGVYLVRVVSSLFLVALAATSPLAVSFGPLAGAAPLLGLVVLVVVGRRVGRRMEERSDRLGLEHQGDDAGTYAKALALVYEANLTPVVTKTGRKNVHPDLYDRLIASGAPPDYPRPEPPPGVRLASVPLYFLAIAAFLVVVASLAEIPEPVQTDPTGGMLPSIRRNLS